MSIFGESYGKNIQGEIKMRGVPVDVSNVPKAIKSGLAYVTEDRKELGLVLEESIKMNTTMAALDRVAERGVINKSEEQHVAEGYRKALAYSYPKRAANRGQFVWR